MRGGGRVNSFEDEYEVYVTPHVVKRRSVPVT
jgi:hypothetical protein